MPTPAAIIQQFAANGVAMIEWALLPADMLALDTSFPVLPAGRAGARHTSERFDDAALAAAHATLAAIAADLQCAPVRLVRTIYFDKTPHANWFVPWHQDRSIAVERRVEVPGFARWTIKDGAVHVEPPVALLEAIVTLRVHLDACTETDGALEVVPGSHRVGRLERPQFEQTIAQGLPLLCLAERGDILAMRPLLVHRSQRASKPGHRRVLHLEYTAEDLPAGLAFATRTLSTVDPM